MSVYYRTTAVYFVRLRTARPIRLALACVAQYLPGRNLRFAGPFDPEKAEEFADRIAFDDSIVLSVSITPEFFQSALNEVTLLEMKETTSLRIGRSGLTLPLKRYVPPFRSITNEALFIFDRPAGEIPVSELRFNTEFGERFRVELDPTFRARDLMFEGKPEW